MLKHILCRPVKSNRFGKMNFDIFGSICNRSIEFIDLPVTVQQTDDISGTQIILEKTASMTLEGVMNKKSAEKWRLGLSSPTIFFPEKWSLMPTGNLFFHVWMLYAQNAWSSVQKMPLFMHPNHTAYKIQYIHARRMN